MENGYNLFKITKFSKLNRKVYLRQIDLQNKKQLQSLTWRQNYLPQVGLESPMSKKSWKWKIHYESEKKVHPCSSTNVMTAHMLLQQTFVVYICLKGKKARHQEILFSFMTHFMRCNIEEISMKSSQNILTRLLWSDEPAFGEYKCWWSWMCRKH